METPKIDFRRAILLQMVRDELPPEATSAVSDEELDSAIRKIEEGRAEAHHRVDRCGE